MTERPLMSADELKSLKPGSFIVMKTGAHPFISKLKLFTKWGIVFDKGAYTVPDKAARPVSYASKSTIFAEIDRRYPGRMAQLPPSGPQDGGATHGSTNTQGTPVRTAL